MTPLSSPVTDSGLKVQLVLASDIEMSAWGFWKRFLRTSEGQEGRDIIASGCDAWICNNHAIKQEGQSLSTKLTWQ